MKVRLYSLPASHPGTAAAAMLERKGIPYARTDLFPSFSKPIVRALGFPGTSVPALKIDGRRVQGSREIARELDRLRPDPPLFPADPEARVGVEEAERFGEEEMQHPVRQIFWWCMRKDSGPLRGYAEGAKLGVPVGLAMGAAAPVVALTARINGANDENVREDLAKLAGFLDRVDELIAAGTIGGEEPNAADFQIAPSLRFAMTLQDLRPLIDGRPAGAFARRVIPSYPGDTPPILPPAWLEPLRESAAA